ncbi:MAG: Hpt domain-containing protein, partial [Eubacteriales bacterium]|nr:Hpt domain-containing protein [Eubacteriales bacterium]
ESVLKRFMGEERVEKYVKMFLRDDSYDLLLDALRKERIEDAFLAAHTLKGVCLNIGFSRLYDSASIMTEALRAGDRQGAQDALPALRRDYEEITESIKFL